METYKQMNNRHQQEVNDFPIGFAFSQDQLKKELERLGVTKDEVIGIGYGGFIRKSDRDAYIKMMKKHESEQKEAMQDAKFAYSAFLYELNNHEYNYTGDPTDALIALGLSVDDVVNNPVLNKAYCKAEKQARIEAEW